MKAFAFSSKLLNFSFNYDGLTLYPTFKAANSTAIAMVMNDCRRLEFVEVPNPFDLTKDSLNLQNVQEEVEKNQSGFDRYVFQSDKDHLFYHQDNFNTKNQHFHLKFKSMLTEQQLKAILDLFEKRALLDHNESVTFLEEFNKRYQDSRTSLLNSITQNKKTDTKLIINFIQKCGDNDVLADLHDNLLCKKTFNYLRSRSRSGHHDFWQGTNEKGQLEKTSKSWAMIEKAFALQMAENINQTVQQVKPVLSERALQLSQHPFFSIKRKSIPRGPSKFFNEFKNVDVQGFENSYEKHFRAFK